MKFNCFGEFFQISVPVGQVFSARRLVTPENLWNSIVLVIFSAKCSCWLSFFSEKACYSRKPLEFNRFCKFFQLSVPVFRLSCLAGTLFSTKCSYWLSFFGQVVLLVRNFRLSAPAGRVFRLSDLAGWVFLSKCSRWSSFFNKWSCWWSSFNGSFANAIPNLIFCLLFFF